MMLYLGLQLVLLVIGISIVARVWRASALDGVLCLIVPFYVLLPMFKHWKDPDFDIRWHVLALFVCASAVVWAQFHAAREVVRETATRQALLRDAAPESEDVASAAAESAATAQEGDDAASEQARLARYQQGVEFGSKAAAAQNAAAQNAAADAAPVARSHEPDTPVRAPSAAASAPLTPQQALARATFQRGTFERATLGFAIDVPSHFHVLAAGDARRIEASRGLPGDAREVAWIVHESVALDSSAAWYVRVRWLSDGWVPPAGTLDGWRLLQQAQRGRSAHLAGSGGDLIGYAIAPSFSAGVADWVEERLPAGAGASVLDCHALRLGRRGVLEFSVVGAAAGAQALCDASVRLLARSTRFERGADWSPAATDANRAPYSLAELIGAAP